MINEVEIFTDGACSGNPGEAGIGVVILQNKNVIKEVSRAIGLATNNIAEYSAFICALEEAKKLNAQNLKIYSDSELLVKQATGQYKIKNQNLKALLDQAREISKSFKQIELRHIPRAQNTHADRLATNSIKYKNKNKSGDCLSDLTRSKEESPSFKG